MAKKRATEHTDENAAPMVMEAPKPDAQVIEGASSDPNLATEVESVTQDTEIALPIERGRSAEIEKEDLVLPTLRMGQRVGNIGEEFGHGALVVDGEVAASDGKTPVEVTVLEYQKCFVERKEFGTGMPDVLYSQAEVNNLGLTTEWHDNEEGDRVPPDYDATLNCRILLKKPEGLEDADLYFPFKFADEHFAMLAWTLTKSAYTRGARRILSAFAHKIFPTTASGFFRVSTELSSFGKNKTYVPVIGYGEHHSPEVVEWASSMV